MAKENDGSKKKSINSKKLLSSLEGKNKLFLTLAALIAVGGLLYFNIGLFVAATVNGVPISRLSVIKELENQGGSQVLESIITQEIIKQEIASEGIVVTNDEIDAKTSEVEKQLEEQGMDLETALSYQGQTSDNFRKNIKLQISVEKLFGGEEATDEEASQYFEQNKNLYSEEVVFEDVKDDLKSQLSQQKLSEKYQAFIQEKIANSSIKRLVNY